MSKSKDTMVRISATVRRSTRDKMKFLSQQRTSAGRPTSESRRWSEAGTRYIQEQVDMPGSRENTSQKITERMDVQAAELAALRAEFAKLQAEIMAQRKFLVQLNTGLQPIIERLKPPANRGG